MGNDVAPAFYALRSGGWRDYVTFLHPPYTLWHLSYVAFGAAVMPPLVLWRLGGTLVAFFLAVGIGAHALDELHGRPLGTGIDSRLLLATAIASITAAMVLGLVYGGWKLLPFVVIGGVLVYGYNLELFGGRLHSDVWFAFAWGAFPALTAFFASAQTVRAEGFLIAAFAFTTSLVQQRLSVDVRHARRTLGDTSQARAAEVALKLLALSMPLLAGAVLLSRWHY